MFPGIYTDSIKKMVTVRFDYNIYSTVGTPRNEFTYFCLSFRMEMSLWIFQKYKAVVLEVCTSKTGLERQGIT